MTNITSNDIYADLHTHSLFSKHAYSSVKENIEEAKRQKLKYIAITDHYFGNGDDLEKKNEVNRIKYLSERVNTFEDGITVIGTAEFNLNQDVYTFEKLESLIWKPIGFHNWFLDTESVTLDSFLNLFIEAHKKGYNAFVHIERELHKINHGNYTFDELMSVLYKVVDYAKENDIWLEVNESSIVTNECGGVERLNSWLKYAKENKNKIYLGTDAHYCLEVGRFENTIKLLNDLEYPRDLILNCNLDMLEETFKI